MGIIIDGKKVAELTRADIREEADPYLHRIREDDLFDILEELHASAKEYKNFEAWFLHIEEYAEELEKIRMQKQDVKEGVTLATLHSAKGLEFDHVYIIDVNEGMIPYKKAVLEQEIEEERRLFYVGMTRARKDLYLFSAKQINRKDVDVSRFITEIKEKEAEEMSEKDDF